MVFWGRGIKCEGQWDQEMFQTVFVSTVDDIHPALRNIR